MTSPYEIARGWIGTPYRHQMSSRGLGCDCLGLLRGVWAELYGEENPEQIPNYGPSWNEHLMDDPLIRVAEKYLVRCSEISERSVLFFRMRPDVSVKHCAIASGRSTIVHSVSRRGVREETLSPHWKRKIHRKFRFP